MPPLDVLARYLKAYEARDLDAVAAVLADDVHLQDWNLQAQGKAAVLAETRRNFEAAQALTLEARQWFEGPGCAAARLRIVVNGSIELEVVDTVTVNAHGLITAIRAYKG